MEFDRETRAAFSFVSASSLRECIRADRGIGTEHGHSARKPVCPRCLQWEREALRLHHPHAISSRTLASKRLLFKASDAPFPSIPILTQVNPALRARRVPALRAFRSCAWRKAHFTSKHCRSFFCTRDVSKPFLRAVHPRCELCSPCDPCILPFWAFTSFSRSTSTTPSYGTSAADDQDSHPAVPGDCHVARELFADRTSHTSGTSSHSSGFAETEREGPAAAACAALDRALPTASWHTTDRPGGVAIGLDKELGNRAFRPAQPHDRIDSSSADAATSRSALCSQGSLRRPGVAPFGTESWHVVDTSSSTLAGCAGCSARSTHQATAGPAPATPSPEAHHEPCVGEETMQASLESGSQSQFLHRALQDMKDASAFALHTVSSSVPDGQTALSVAEQALSNAGKLGADLIAATVSAGRPSGCQQDISVQLPAADAEAVQVTSSEENSPQLVDVLRQSALYERYRDMGERPFAVGPHRRSDSHMSDVLEDSLDLDESWHIVDGAVSDAECAVEQMELRGSLDKAKGFLERLVPYRLRHGRQ